ncbi:MAG: Flp family type IVb pilin [Rhodomicrobium sp.]|jgi:pilus assembly protein Flp/PilA
MPEFPQGWLRTFVNDERGATMVEYAIVVGLIAAVGITAVTRLGTDLSTAFTYFAGKIPNG